MKPRPHLNVPTESLFCKGDRRWFLRSVLAVAAVVSVSLVLSSWLRERDAASSRKSSWLLDAQHTLSRDDIRDRAAHGDAAARRNWLDALRVTGAAATEIREQQRHWESLDTATAGH